MLPLLVIDEESQLATCNLALKTVLPFKEIIVRDKGQYKLKGDVDGRKKYMATLEFTYIYWEGTYKSHYLDEYQDYNIRLENIKKDIGLPEKWKPDEVVNEALEYYIKSQVTKTRKLVKAVSKTITTLEGYFDELDLTEVLESGSHKGELKHDITKVQKAINDLPNTVAALKALENTVDAELEQKKTGKGGRDLGMFEEE